MELPFGFYTLARLLCQIRNRPKSCFHSPWILLWNFSQSGYYTLKGICAPDRTLRSLGIRNKLLGPVSRQVSVQVSLGLAMPSCYCFTGKQTPNSWYCTVLATSVINSWSVALAQVTVKCKLYLTATCACVQLMSSRDEWDGGMSAMNTFFTR